MRLTKDNIKLELIIINKNKGSIYCGWEGKISNVEEDGFYVDWKNPNGKYLSKDSLVFYSFNGNYIQDFYLLNFDYQKVCKNKNKSFHYRISFHEPDGEWVATCDEYPSLSFLDADFVKAITGIKQLVEEESSAE